jgi:hypothetical protein
MLVMEEEGIGCKETMLGDSYVHLQKASCISQNKQVNSIQRVKQAKEPFSILHRTLSSLPSHLRLTSTHQSLNLHPTSLESLQQRPKVIP